jgi:hypothetical protein
VNIALCARCGTELDVFGELGGPACFSECGCADQFVIVLREHNAQRALAAWESRSRRGLVHEALPNQL